jgi:hypothetical protein
MPAAPIADGLGQSIWKAEHSKFPGKVVAVKVLKPPSGPDFDMPTCMAALKWITRTTALSSAGNHVGSYNDSIALPRVRD